MPAWMHKSGGYSRAQGGPVWPGRRYVVGEEGPETFIPDSPGVIAPNHMMANRSGETSYLDPTLAAAHPLLGPKPEGYLEQFAGGGQGAPAPQQGAPPGVVAPPIPGSGGYAEFLRENPEPEFEAPKISKSRRWGAIIGGALKSFAGEDGTGMMTDILEGPKREAEKDYLRSLYQRERGATEAFREEQLGRQAAETRDRIAQNAIPGAPTRLGTREVGGEQFYDMRGPEGNITAIRGGPIDPPAPRAPSMYNHFLRASGVPEGETPPIEILERYANMTKPQFGTPGQQVGFEKDIDRLVADIEREEALLQTVPLDAADRGISAETIQAKRQRAQALHDLAAKKLGLPPRKLFGDGSEGLPPGWK